MYSYSGQIIATSAEITPNGGLVRESSQNPLNSGLGIIVICPELLLFAYCVETGRLEGSSSDELKFSVIFRENHHHHFPDPKWSFSKGWQQGTVGVAYP